MRLFSENFCTTLANCYRCRNDRETRKKLFEQGWVDEIDFKCLPLEYPIGCSLSILPRATRNHEKRIPEVKELIENIPIALNVLRKIVEGKDISKEYNVSPEQALEMLERFCYPKGIYKPCDHAVLTSEFLDTSKCGCATDRRLIICTKKDGKYVIGECGKCEHFEIK